MASLDRVVNDSYVRAKSRNVNSYQELAPAHFLCQLGESHMTLRWAARGLVLAVCALVTRSAAAQATQQSSRDPVTGSSLGQNYPNPFNPETTIPFSIGGAPTCSDLGRQYRVSLKIYNVLAQLVATPVLQGGSASVAGGQPLAGVLLTCGQYTAYWDGKYMNNGREVASGVYMYRLEIDGKPIIRKMIVMK